MADLQVEIISVHLPKTAGTAFRKVLQQVYSREEVFIDEYPNHSQKKTMEIWGNQQRQIKVIHGHFPLKKYAKLFPKARKIIWLRNPIKRLISHFIYKQSREKLAHRKTKIKERKKSFLDFCETNKMQNMLAKMIKNNDLNDFYFVGLQEFFTEDLTELQTLLGWQEVKVGHENKSKGNKYKDFSKAILSDRKIVERIVELNSKDMEIYARALNLREKRRKSSNLSDKTLEIKPILPLENKLLSVPTVSICSSTEGKRHCPTEVSLGRLREVVLKGQTMELTGWTLSLTGALVDGFQIYIGDEKITEWEETLGIPSPEIKKAHPKLPNAATAGFSLRVHLNPERVQQCYDSPIAVIPRFGDRQGSILLNVFAPSLKLPDRSELKKVGINNPNNFQHHAWRWLGFLIQRVGLLPTDRLLDVGCGMGNIAYGLAYYLTSTGGYEGFDVIDQSWARQQIATGKPNFLFRDYDIHHPMYNPTGTVSPDEFVFPYPQESFDLVCIINLFAHLQKAAVGNYLKQASLVLKPGGRCLCTFFLINSESKEAIAKGNSAQNLVYEIEGTFTKEPELPEKAMGFPEATVLKWIEYFGFRVIEKYYGFWCGRTAVFGPDLLILEKKPVGEF